MQQIGKNLRQWFEEWLEERFNPESLPTYEEISRMTSKQVSSLIDRLTEEW